jgi:hypothetical protein
MENLLPFFVLMPEETSWFCNWFENDTPVLRVHTEWQRPLSGVHFIKMEKLAQAGVRGGSAHPPPFTAFTISFKVAVYAPAVWADTLTLFHLCSGHIKDELIEIGDWSFLIGQYI